MAPFDPGVGSTLDIDQDASQNNGHSEEAGVHEVDALTRVPSVDVSSSQEVRFEEQDA